jgi:[ribosomal protein S5]-alanine N-acetyltransferase
MEKLMQTPRLLLRPFQPHDVNDLFEYASVEGVGERAGWPHHKSIEQSQQILNRFMESSEVYAIVHRADNKVIGSIGLHHRPDESSHQEGDLVLGYVLSKSYWGQGLMTEAAERILYEAFIVWNVPRIRVAHFKENMASQRVIEKLGFIYEKDGHYTTTLLQQVFEERKYILTKEDYNNRSKSAINSGS